MAIKRLTIDGYSALELNQVAFRRDGRIEAQLPLDTTDFATVRAENGMLLVADRINHCVRMPDASESQPVLLNYSSEKMYDERHNALKDFSLGKKDVYPRLGYLAVGDKFTTNCVSYDSSDFADDDAVAAAVKQAALKTAAVYGGMSTDGSILLDTTAPTAGPVLQAIYDPMAHNTLPDGTFGITFRVIKA